MTEWGVPASRPELARPVPLPVAVLTTTAWAAIVGTVPLVVVAVLVWAAERRSGAPGTDAVRLALDAWLLAHGVRLHTVTGPVGLTPLVLSAVVARTLYRAGRNSARATGAVGVADALRVALAVGVVYGVLGAVVAVLAGTAAVRADPVMAALVTGAAGLVVAAVGAVPAAGAGPGGSGPTGVSRPVAADVAGLGKSAGVGGDPVTGSDAGAVTSAGRGASGGGRLSVLVGAVRAGRPGVLLRAAGIGGAVATAALLGAAALVTGVALAGAAGRARDVFGLLSPGLVGSLGLWALCLLYAPTAVVWTASYLVGPGFAVGTGSTVSAATVTLGALPSFPLLAAVPTGPAPTAVRVVQALPLLAGLLAGLGIGGGPAARGRWRLMVGAALLAGPVAGVLMSAVALAAGGPLGGGRLAAVGPSPWRVGLVFGLEVALAALVGATLRRGLASWAVRKARTGRAGAAVRRTGGAPEPAAQADGAREATDAPPGSAGATEGVARPPEVPASPAGDDGPGLFDQESLPELPDDIRPSRVARVSGTDTEHASGPLAPDGERPDGLDQ